MAMLLAFAPFIAFAVIDRLVGGTAGLFSGAAVSAAMLVRDWVTPNRTPKLLEIGTALLFAGLALWAVVSGPGWAIAEVRLRVDGGLLTILLVSMAVGRPFTLEYAREQVAPALWDSAVFVQTNYVISGAWALAFAVLAGADLMLIYLPDIPVRVAVILTILALTGAIRFTGWYPQRGQVGGGAGFGPARIR